MKRRSCRRTKEENNIHERAVKIRKMTDEQLVQYIEDIEKKAIETGRTIGYAEGFDDGQRKAQSVREFLENLDIPGIGKSTKEKLWKNAAERAFLIE